MKEIIKRTIYVTSLISLIFLIFLVIEMFPFIFESRWQGILLILSIIILLIVELLIFTFNRKIIKKNICHNIYIMCATIYIGIIYYKLYNLKYLENSLYEINISNCKFYYLIGAIIFLLISLNLIFSSIIKKKINLMNKK